MASADTVQQALDKLAETFQNEDKAADLAKLTRHAVSLLKNADTRASGVEAVIQLQDQLHIARRLGNYVQEANLVEAIAGRMRTDDAYGLESSVPMVQAEQSDEMKALIKQMQTLDCIACSILSEVDGRGRSPVSSTPQAVQSLQAVQHGAGRRRACAGGAGGAAGARILSARPAARRGLPCIMSIRCRLAPYLRATAPGKPSYVQGPERARCPNTNLEERKTRQNEKTKL
ncbi:unnamed protein product [Symbiodinium sp. CCMP2592]|nr:unnamed protein product [Symbiodinium sp. CCMP2592]